MKEIKFRGKRVDSGEWVIGSLYQDYDTPECASIIPIGSLEDKWHNLYKVTAYDVDYKTVGQFTGLKDHNQVEIYNGDIIDGSYRNPMTGEMVKRIYLVVFENGCYIAKLIGKSPYGDTQLYFVNEKCKVIGNIHDNPELVTSL